MLRKQEVNGRTALVAYLDKIGGKMVEPDQAQVVIVNYLDGEKAFFFPEKKVAIDCSNILKTKV